MNAVMKIPSDTQPLARPTIRSSNDADLPIVELINVCKSYGEGRQKTVS